MSVSTQRAIFAGGCFWCTEAQFADMDGVLSVTSGYTGGSVANPTYDQVSAKKTGHAEAVEIIYDPAQVSYERLLDTYWQSIDPTDPGGQFFDRGEPYQTAIFYTEEAQRIQAEASKESAEKALGKKVFTRILPVSTFYPAEEYHQNYYRKNPTHYNAYKNGSDRENRLKQIWKG